MPRLRPYKARKPFTLLEVMVAICIFSVIASASGWQIFHMVSNYRFINQVGDCFASLQNAQALSLIYRTDLILEIFIENGIYYYKISSEEPFPPVVLHKEIPYSLSEVKVCEYDNCPVTNQKWHISSNGLIHPRGIIHFYKQRNNGLWIDLQKGFLVQCTRSSPK